MVACGDFTEGGKRLIEFAQLKNTCIDSEQNGYGTELSSILAAIQEQDLIPPEVLRDFFWDLFIADAFLGNFDRHNGNWGILVDEGRQKAEIAPVYDCGSCLYPQLAGEEMEHVMESRKEIEQRVYTFPNSAIMVDGKKLSYFQYISSLTDPDCNAALHRIAPRIDMEAIEKIIEEAPVLLPIQRTFYCAMLRERKERIIDFSMEHLMSTEQTQNEERGPKLTLS